VEQKARVSALFAIPIVLDMKVRVSIRLEMCGRIRRTLNEGVWCCAFTRAFFYYGSKTRATYSYPLCLLLDCFVRSLPPDASGFQNGFSLQ